MHRHTSRGTSSSLGSCSRTPTKVWHTPPTCRPPAHAPAHRAAASERKVTIASCYVVGIARADNVWAKFTAETLPRVQGFPGLSFKEPEKEALFFSSAPGLLGCELSIKPGGQLVCIAFYHPHTFFLIKFLSFLPSPFSSLHFSSSFSSLICFIELSDAISATLPDELPPSYQGITIQYFFFFLLFFIFLILFPFLFTI